MLGAYVANFANALINAVSKLLQLAGNEILVEEEFQLRAAKKGGAAAGLEGPLMLCDEVESREG